VEKIDVIYRGRDPKAFTPASHETRVRSRGLLAGRGNAPIVLSVARLLKRKGQEDLLQSFALVKAKFPRALLVLVGEGPQRKRLEALSAKLGVLGNVRFLGTRFDVPELLQSADVFAFPSHYEGHGGALVEAMFAALPIVASDIPVHRESVEHNISAHLVPPRNPRLLAEGILRLLEHPEEARPMGRSARSAAMEKFDIAAITRQHEDLYERVLAEAL
jgi:glycosyltransferase involved in cell wall biosynthesis